MGNYKCRKPGYLSAFQISVCEATFQGRSNKWIYEHLYHVNLEDQKAVRSAANKLRALRSNPKFREYYDSIVTEFRVHGYGKAINKLTELIDDRNKWVAIQAATSLLAHTEKAVISNEENTVTVKIEGLPTIGVPEGEEPESLDEAQRLILSVGETVEAESSVV